MIHRKYPALLSVLLALFLLIPAAFGAAENREAPAAEENALPASEETALPASEETALPAGAAGVVPLIQDDADLLTAAEEEQLYQRMLPLCAYGTPMFWTTTEGGDFEYKAAAFFHKYLKNGQSGTLFVINMKVRQLTVFSDGAIHRTVTRAEAETITDNVFRLARDGRYYDCAESVFDQILSLMKGEEIARPMKTASNALLALVLTLLAVYLYLSRRYENPKAGKANSALPVTAGAAAVFSASLANKVTHMTKQSVTDLRDSGGGGGFSGGGGGGGGGGFSGGGGSHGF